MNDTNKELSFSFMFKKEGDSFQDIIERILINKITIN